VNIGKLYQIKDDLYLLFLFPSKEASTAHTTARAAFEAADTVVGANYWGERMHRLIGNSLTLKKKTMFCLLEQDEQCCKILTTNGELGWISYPVNEVWAKGCIDEVKDQ